MFVIRADAHTTLPDRVHAHLARWERDVGNVADGWLGLTAGVDENGNVVVLTRYATEESALIAHDLPESERWWQELDLVCDEAVTLRVSADVSLLLDGGTDDAARVVLTTSHSVRDDRLARWLAMREAPAKDRGHLHGGFSFWTDEGVTECWYLEEDDGKAASHLLDNHLKELRSAELVELRDPVLATAKNAVDEPPVLVIPT